MQEDGDDCAEKLGGWRRAGSAGGSEAPGILRGWEGWEAPYETTDRGTKSRSDPSSSRVTKSGCSAVAGSLVSPKGSETPLPLCDSVGEAECDRHCISLDVDGRRGPLLSLGSIPRVGVTQKQDTSTSLFFL